MGSRTIAPGSANRPSAMSNIADDLVKWQYLKAIMDEKKVREAKTQQEISERVDKEKVERDKRIEAERLGQVEELTGHAPTPEMTPFFAKQRELSKPGAQVIEGEPATRGFIGKGGEDLPSGGNLRPMFAQPKDIRAAGVEGAQRYRGEMTERADRLPIEEKDKSYVTGEIGARTGVYTPSEIVGEATNIRKELAEATKGEAEAKEAGVKARIAGLTEYDKVAQEGLKTEKDRYETGISGAKSRYAEIDAYYDMENKRLEMAKRDAEVAKQPDEAAKLKLEIGHLEDERAKAKQEIDSRDRQQVIINRLKTEQDPGRRRQLIETLVSEQTGGGAALLKDDTDAQKEIMDRTEHLLKVGATLDESILKNSEESVVIADAYNRAAIGRAERGRYNEVILRPVGTELGLMGGTTYKIGQARLPIPIAKMYTTGLLERIASGQAQPGENVYTDSDGTQKVLTPGQALATHVRITNSYTNDSSVWKRAIEGFNTDPMIKNEAWGILSKIKSQSAAEEAKPKGKITGAELPTSPEKMPQTGAEIESRDIAKEKQQQTQKQTDYESNRKFLEWLAGRRGGKPITQMTNEEIAKSKKEYEASQTKPTKPPAPLTPKPRSEIKDDAHTFLVKAVGKDPATGLNVPEVTEATKPGMIKIAKEIRDEMFPGVPFGKILGNRELFERFLIEFDHRHYDRPTGEFGRVR